MSLDKSKIHILVVDDFSTMRKLVISTLKRNDYNQISEAENGETALSKLRTENIDIVVADWNMPTMSGFELLQQIRGDEKLKETPVLMVTAEAQVTNIVAAVKAGVTDYIVKPFNEITFAEKIDKIANGLNG